MYALFVYGTYGTRSRIQMMQEILCKWCVVHDGYRQADTHSARQLRLHTSTLHICIRKHVGLCSRVGRGGIGECSSRATPVSRWNSVCAVSTYIFHIMIMYVYTSCVYGACSSRVASSLLFPVVTNSARLAPPRRNTHRHTHANYSLYTCVYRETHACRVVNTRNLHAHGPCRTRAHRTHTCQLLAPRHRSKTSANARVRRITRKIIADGARTIDGSLRCGQEKSLRTLRAAHRIKISDVRAVRLALLDGITLEAVISAHTYTQTEQSTSAIV